MRPECSPSPRYEINVEKIAHRRDTTKIGIEVDTFYKTFSKKTYRTYRLIVSIDRDISKVKTKQLFQQVRISPV